MNINYIVRNYLLFFLFTVFFVIILIYAYPWLLSNSYFVIFELGGPVPLHSNIWLMNSYLSYFENLGVRGLYGIGWPSYVIIYILSLSSHIGGIGVGERLWLISDLLISFIFSYKLFRIAFKSKIIPYVNALAYTFSPAMAVLVYSTSWETLLLYAFSPIIIYLSYKAFKNFGFGAIKFDLMLIAVFMYIYYFNEQVIMWEGLIILFMAFFSTMRTLNRKNIFLNLAKLLLFFSFFIFFSNSLNVIDSFVAGHGVSAFSVADFGATSVSNVLTDLEGNFVGYWMYAYAYFLWITTITFLILIIFFKRRIKLGEAALTLISLNIIDLIVWTVFRFNIEPLARMISLYVPIFGAYSVLSGFLMVSNTILIAAFLIQIPLTINFENKHFKSKIKKLTNRSPAILISIVIFVSSISIPMQYSHISPDRYASFPSEIDMHPKSQKFLNTYDVPDNISRLSEWFCQNTDIKSGYRIYLGPVSTSTSQAIIQIMDFTSTVNLSSFASNAIGAFEYNGNLTPLAGVFALEGVKYFIVYKGPNINSNQNFTGPASFVQYGWPWQLSYAPIGSWENWSKLLNESTAFKLVANIPGSIVYENTDYTGIIYAYNFTNLNYTYVMNNTLDVAKYGFYSNDIEYSLGDRYLANWTFVDYHIWSINNKTHTYKITNSSLHIETSITTILNVTPKSFLYFKYLIEGQNMTYSVVMVRYYNSNGSQIGILASNDWSNPWNGNISKLAFGSFITRAPHGATKAYVQLVVNIMNGTEVEFKNVSFTSVGTVGPVPINYSFIKPYLISLSDVPERSLIMLNANYFNGWEISETSSKSVPFFNSMYVINSFFYNSNTTNITIILQSQKSYDYYLAAQWVTWIGLLIMIPTLYLIERKYHL